MFWANFTSNTPPEGRVKLEFSKPSTNPLVIIIVMMRSIDTYSIRMILVPVIFINVETPAVGTVQDLDQSQTFSASSVAAPDDVEASAVSAVETVMYRDLWQISSAVTQ